MSSMDLDGAYLLARDHLAEPLPRRWAHVEAVARAAMSLAGGLEVPDQTLLISAAWLHDIGYSPVVTQTGFHPLDGARYVRRLGADMRLCSLVAHHTAARTEADLRGLAGVLDSEFPQEQSQAADLLWLADLTTGPSGELMTVEERLHDIVRRYGPAHLVALAAIVAGPELVAAAGRARACSLSTGRNQSTCAAAAFAIP